MLVFGDAPRREPPQALLAALAQALRDTAAMPPGIIRHGALADAFVAAGELAQGLADAEFEQRGHDAPSPLQDAAMALLLRLAEAIGLSWSSAFTRLPPLPEPVLPGPLPETIAPKRAEGFAFYALYPEAYLDAAAKAGLGPQTRVIGLRSIGAPLASLVASALGAAPPVTLRPVGHPFGRQLALSPSAAAALLEGAGDFAIVDEGPGLSGSSMGAVADFLEDGGVAPGRLHFFPGHAGDPGPMASPRHRARWQSAPRHLTSFDALVLEAPDPRHRLPAWVADLTGLAEAPLRDISGGGWRALRYASEAEWPAVNPQQERRKFLLRAGGASLAAEIHRAGCGCGAAGGHGGRPRRGRLVAPGGRPPPRLPGRGIPARSPRPGPVPPRSGGPPRAAAALSRLPRPAFPGRAWHRRPARPALGDGPPEHRRGPGRSRHPCPAPARARSALP
ncbi:hypothetical protein [Siccirubricoccus sp. G192]|uniref:hypothetical protein n=1 Tax=Siccirubricoccus sp. G192 TaxID=2849651 RepID=UPI001C2C9E87|nr:hypothetical protein [Siccirubricoccus sp. G192]MBV1797439.1 hypothetical protein [Siccirubricoccus sp. G192]